MKTLKEKNDIKKEEKKKLKEERDLERQKKQEEKAKADAEKEQNGGKIDGATTKPAPKAGKKTKIEPKKEPKKEEEESLDLASVVKRRRLMVAKTKAEKEVQEKIEKERRLKDQEEMKKQKAEEQFEKTFKEGIANAKLVLRKHPIGYDRNHSRYWLFSPVVPGLFVEKGWASKDIHYSARLDGETDNEEEDGMDVEQVSGEEGEETTIWKEKTVPKIGQNMWFQYDTVKELESLLVALDNQGIRESALFAKIQKHHSEVSKLVMAARRSGPELRDSDGPRELLDSFKEDLKDIETHIRQGNLGGVSKLEKWEKQLDSATKLKELKPLLIESQACVNLKFLQGKMAPTKPKPNKPIYGYVDEDEDDSQEEDDKPIESERVVRWRELVNKATSLSRLHILLCIYEISVKWEKSAANAKCKICRRKGNEDKVIMCDKCNQPFHLFCLRPALPAFPTGEWMCPACAPITVRTGRDRNYAEIDSDPSSESSEDDPESDYDEEDDDDDESDEEVTGRRVTRAVKGKRVKKKAPPARATRGRPVKRGREKPAPKAKRLPKLDKEAADGIISRMLKYRDSKPLRQPPTKAEVPNYKKLIKNPMDLQVMKTKCEGKDYSKYPEFFDDMQLTFSNAAKMYENDNYILQQVRKTKDYCGNLIKWHLEAGRDLWNKYLEEEENTRFRTATRL
ncbi:tyrosine-protein kinase BAZ1B-like [Strongylocentrotus purpuratus]|uniref:Tyrosine-protein kinase BAZ1B n=1 Tax=Strongylocentrotus purpuratus TaxID=7668 RepID=A0A7M7PDN6_STRPU|nr:tyrosine-protein kinase BAZ1B-like [Strongylocentrotus purpuratus]